MKPQETRIGYLMVGTPVPNIYLGGLMVVDGRGLPLEFRYTEPIQPTKIQQVLYGSALGRFIKTEVILGTLLASVENTPHLLIVNDESFLMGTEALSGFTVTRLMETRLPSLRGVGALEKVSSAEYLLQLTPDGSPTRVQLPVTQPEPVQSDAPLSLPDKTLDEEALKASLGCYDTLVETGRQMDILEPMQRVEKALAMLCQEAGFKPSPAA